MLYKTPPSLGNNPFSLSTRLHLFLDVFPIFCPGIFFCSTLRHQEIVIFVPVSSNSSHSGWVVMPMMAWVRLVPVSWNRCGCFSLRSLPACQFQVYIFLRLWGYTVLKILCDWSGWERNLVMRLSLRISLILTIIVVVTGVIAFVRIMAKAGPFPTTYFAIWIVVSVILIGITIWSWLRNGKK